MRAECYRENGRRGWRPGQGRWYRDGSVGWGWALGRVMLPMSPAMRASSVIRLLRFAWFLPYSRPIRYVRPRLYHVTPLRPLAFYLSSFLPSPFTDP